jgi:hypothetical protein
LRQDLRGLRRPFEQPRPVTASADLPKAEASFRSAFRDPRPEPKLVAVSPDLASAKALAIPFGLFRSSLAAGPSGLRHPFEQARPVTASADLPEAEASFRSAFRDPRPEPGLLAVSPDLASAEASAIPFGLVRSSLATGPSAAFRVLPSKLFQSQVGP